MLKENQNTKKTQKKLLLYIMDPYCGWCYGNSKTIEKLSNEYQIEIIPAGMWSGINARTGNEIKNFVQKGSLMVTKTTGAQFSTMYFDLLDKNLKFDSEITSRAINTIKEIENNYSSKVTQFLNLMFNQHFYYGKEQNLDLFKQICKQIKIDENKFEKLFDSEELKHKTQTEFSRAWQLARKYPTLIAVSQNGDIELIEGNYNYEKYKIEIEKIMSED